MELRGGLLALGAMLIGVVSIVFGSYALQWQPVPAAWPGAEIGPYISGVILIVAGAACVWAKTAVWGARALVVFFGLWVVVLHGINVARQPDSLVIWLGFFEILGMASGALMLSALVSGNAQLKLVARIAFGLCPLIYGASHFVYASATASMVPAWIPPGQMFWAYATGAGHLAAGVAILSGVMGRLAAGLLTLMFASFAVFLHAPRVVADPGNHVEWTMLAVALTLTGAAFVMWRSFGTTPAAEAVA